MERAAVIYAAGKQRRLNARVASAKPPGPARNPSLKGDHDAVACRSGFHAAACMGRSRAGAAGQNSMEPDASRAFRALFQFIRSRSAFSLDKLGKLTVVKSNLGRGAIGTFGRVTCKPSKFHRWRSVAHIRSKPLRLVLSKIAPHAAWPAENVRQELEYFRAEDSSGRA